MSAAVSRNFLSEWFPCYHDPVHASADDSSVDVLVEHARAVCERVEAVAVSMNEEAPNLFRSKLQAEEAIVESDNLENIAKDLGNDDRKRLLKESSSIRNRAEAIISALDAEPKKSLFRLQKKWVSAGYDEGVLTTDPEAVRFAVETEVLYTILMFQESADMLDGEMLTIKIVDGKALFKVQGEWLPYESFKGYIRYSAEERRFVGWNFVHPDGFVPVDSVNFSSVYPIAKLKPEVYSRVVEQANKFWNQDQNEIDPSVPKGYVLQVMTTGRDCFPKSWLLRNLEEYAPEHSSTRLITPDGYVYSFGTRMRPVDADRVTKLTNILTTAITHVPVPDYEEPRSADEKRVTFIPITKERFDSICSYVNEANRGFPFNFANANCARFVQSIMKLAGVTVNITMTPPQFLFGCLPSLYQVPVIGKPLERVMTTVSYVATPIFDGIAAVFLCLVPPLLTKIWEVCTWAAVEILKRIRGVFFNFVAVCLFGAGRTYMTLGRIETEKQKEPEKTGLPNSSRLLNWWNFFCPDAIVFYHAAKLKEWQKRQYSSVFYTKPESGLACLDPMKGVPVA